MPSHLSDSTQVCPGINFTQKVTDTNLAPKKGAVLANKETGNVEPRTEWGMKFTPECTEVLVHL